MHEIQDTHDNKTLQLLRKKLKVNFFFKNAKKQLIQSISMK